MSERVTADDVRHVETKIIMTEDKCFEKRITTRSWKSEKRLYF